MTTKKSPNTKHLLAVFVVIFIFLMSAVAVWFPPAVVMFDKLLPALMLVLGYYFGSKS